jgi:cell division protein FtsW
MARRREQMSSFTQGLVPPLLVAGLMAGLTILQPDLGNSLALIILPLTLAYLAGARTIHMLAIAGAALPVVGLLIALKPYRWRRMLAFVNPWDDPQGSGFQIIQSFLALGSGGWFGRTFSTPSSLSPHPARTEAQTSSQAVDALIASTSGATRVGSPCLPLEPAS